MQKSGRKAGQSKQDPITGGLWESLDVGVGDTNQTIAGKLPYFLMYLEPTVFLNPQMGNYGISVLIL